MITINAANILWTFLGILCALMLPLGFFFIRFNHLRDLFRPTEITMEKQKADELYEMNLLLEQKVLEASQANEDLTKTQEKLLQSQKLESIGKLAGGIAHDFNNLLGGILGYASLLKEQFKQDKAAKKKLEVIVKSAERGARLTQQLLGFARKGQYLKEAISFNNTIAEAIELLERSIDKKINIETDLQSDLWGVEADPTQILQILVNLGLNSSDAMPEGGTIKITTENKLVDYSMSEALPDLKSGNYVLVQVIDTGHGIESEIIDKVFDPFFTTKDIGKGTGLGLAMVYGIMEKHQAVIKLHSTVGQGTTVSLYFQALDKACVNKDVQDDSPEQEFKFNKKMTVLIVDDEPIMREIAKDIVEEKGLSTICAPNGEEGFELFKDNQQKIDLIILDVMMPVMGGIETFRKIREIDSEIPIIFSSGFNESDEIADLKDDDAVIFIQKPYGPEVLLESFDRFV